jgi:hypothetical protein
MDIIAGVAQLVRASACHAEGRGFKSHHSRTSGLKTAKAVFSHSGEPYFSGSNALIFASKAGYLSLIGTSHSTGSMLRMWFFIVQFK